MDMVLAFSLGRDLYQREGDRPPNSQKGTYEYQFTLKGTGKISQLKSSVLPAGKQLQGIISYANGNEIR
jgi:hypothetical protein